MKKRFNHIVLTLMVLLLFTDCKREAILQPMESTKNFNGDWSIIKALRNGTDMTQRFDFTDFRLKISDSSYDLSGLVPFPVTSGGSFYVDDPKYPFKIFLKEAGNQVKELNLQYPINEGERNIIIRFSPGCSANTYEYTLQKIEP